MTEIIAPKCDYCGEPSVFCPSSAHVYNGRDFGPIYDCRKCDAYVGVHPGKDRKPKGRLANAGLRKAKMAAHAVFDPLWKKKAARGDCNKKVARGKAYKWLARELGMKPDDCHIGFFDVADCERVIQACAELASANASRKAA